MDFHQPFGMFRDKIANMGREAFLARYKDPFLVIDLGVGEGKNEAFHTMDGTAKPDRATEPISRRTGMPSSVLAIPVAKSDRNTFHNMITMGRASNNDVVIPHPSVSKFHAYFRVDESGVCSLLDAGSSYGTSVNGVPIKKGGAVSVENEATLQFAKSVSGKFFTPAGLFDFLGL